MDGSTRPGECNIAQSDHDFKRATEQPASQTGMTNIRNYDQHDRLQSDSVTAYGLYGMVNQPFRRTGRRDAMDAE